MLDPAGLHRGVELLGRLGEVLRAGPELDDRDVLGREALRHLRRGPRVIGDGEHAEPPAEVEDVGLDLPEVGLVAVRDLQPVLGGPSGIGRVAALHDGRVVDVAAGEHGVVQGAAFERARKDDADRGEIDPAREVDREMALPARKLREVEPAAARTPATPASRTARCPRSPRY